MKTSMFLATVASYNSNSATQDKNGLMPVLLDIVAGICPSKRVIAGTVSKNMELQEGVTYLFKFTRLEDDPKYGSQYAFTKISAVHDIMQILQATQALGDATLID